ncbi:hypothetical protein P5V15_005034 [Pogonomyrmex californicus]
MRRARIKAFAAVPIRKRLLQDSVDSADADIADKEKKKEDIFNIDVIKQESTKNLAKIGEEEYQDVSRICVSHQEKQDEECVPTTIDISKQQEQKGDISNTDISAQEVAKGISKVQEKDTIKEPIRNEQNEITLKEPTMIKKSDSQELSSPQKSNSQELCTSTKANSQESPSYTGKSNKVTDQLVQKSILPSDVPTVIDITSPTKIQSRPCFMRPTPRLDSGGRIRKNSIQGSGASASESEDEHSKRVASVIPSRVRNDSVCSVQSNKESTVNDNQDNSLRIKTTQKRRMLVSESARKLAEARREFLLKHENRTPDRSQLKMYDLIYYNPVTNPMKKSNLLSSTERKQVPTQSMEIPEEEEEDDPPAMPTPQVKVGPDGQLIIDERSLVIEQTDARRDGELLSNETTIEDDNSHSGGFYKKHKRSKEWPKWETFKFYRVLNVVGTDFLLMQTLFPNRSRQEIKQKYKKEERVNRQLVEKALKYHQEFDTDMLEEQLAMLQKVENIQSTPKTEKIKNGQRMSRAERKRKHRMAAGSIGECEALSNDQETEDTVVSTNDEIDIEMINDINNIQQQMRKGSKMRKLKERSDDRSEKYDDCSSYTDFDADSDSSEEIYKPRPTRSGRLTKKMRKFQTPDFNTLNCTKNESENSKIPSHVAVEVTEYVNRSATDSINMETSNSNNIMTMIPDINQMEPGAVVIVSKESTENPGNTILQVYMVASNIDSNTTVTSSVASMNPSSDSSNIKTKDIESINVVNDCEK